MSAKSRNKKKQNNKKKNMQRKKTNNPNQKSSKKKKSKKQNTQPGQLQTNLSWAVAVILIGLIGFLFFYKPSQFTQTTPQLIKHEHHKLDVSHLNSKHPSIITKYDHSSVIASQLLTQSKQETE